MTAKNETDRDALTGLYTRSEFSGILTTAIAAADGHEHPLALALLDIDSFLLINQKFGRAGGDQVLKVIADHILEILGEHDTAARYGGDEFAILLTDTEREQALLTLEGLRAQIAREDIRFPGGETTRVEFSGGIAAYPIDGTTEPELMRKADQALYRAKELGRNRIRLAYEEKMAPKTSHYTITQLERLSKLAKEEGVGEAELLREALDNLLTKYGIDPIES